MENKKGNLEEAEKEIGDLLKSLPKQGENIDSNYVLQQYIKNKGMVLVEN